MMQHAEDSLPHAFPSPVEPCSGARGGAAVQEAQHGVLHPAPAEQLGARERAGQARAVGEGRLRGGGRAQVAVLARNLRTSGGV